LRRHVDRERRVAERGAELCVAERRRSRPVRRDRERLRRVRLDPRTTALLVIDLQNDTVGEGGAFAHSGAAAFAKEHGVVEKVRSLADAFRAAGSPVIQIWHVDEPGHVDSTRNAELYRSIAEADALVRGTWGAEPVVLPAP